MAQAEHYYYLPAITTGAIDVYSRSITVLLRLRKEPPGFWPHIWTMQFPTRLARDLANIDAFIWQAFNDNPEYMSKRLRGAVWK